MPSCLHLHCSRFTLFWHAIPLILLCLFLFFCIHISGSNLGWKRPQDISSPITWSKRSQLGQARLLKSVLIRTWKPPGMGAERPLWATCFNNWVSSWWKSFSLYAVWSTFIWIYDWYVSFWQYALRSRAWLCFLDDLPVDTGGLLSDTSLTEAISSPQWTSPGPSASPGRANALAPNCLGGSPLNTP